MKAFIILYLFIFNISIVSSNNINTSPFNKPCIFTYIAHVPSLGPVDGVSIGIVLMRHSNVISVWNLKTGEVGKHLGWLNILNDIISSNNKRSFEVEYNSNGFPKKIESKVVEGKEGGWISIIIRDFKYVNSSNDTIDIRQLRMNEFEVNRQKWAKLNAKRYTYIYQDSKEKDMYRWGVEVTVEKGKIIKVRDHQSYQLITDLEKRSFLTIRKLFGIAKKRLENNRQISILYDEMYGYPYSISYRENDGNLHSIFSRNLKKKEF